MLACVEAMGKAKMPFAIVLNSRMGDFQRMAFDVDEYTMLVYWGNVDIPDLKVSLYNSDYNMQELDSSDIDVAIITPPIYIKSIKPYQYIMY